MTWIVHELGAAGWRGTVAEAPGVVIELARGEARLLSRAGLVAFTGTLPWRSSEPTELGPFTRERVAKKDRLAWEHGSVTYSMYSSVAVWSDSFAAFADDQGITVVDATRDRIARVTCGFLWRAQNGRTMGESGDGKKGVHEPKLLIELPAWPRAKYTPLVLVDRLGPDMWQRVEVPGHETRTVIDPDRVTALDAKLRLTRAEHPEGAARPVVARADAAARTKIETQGAAIAAGPDDEGAREGQG